MPLFIRELRATITLVATLSKTPNSTVLRNSVGVWLVNRLNTREK